jgi:hypothetical protein
MPSFNQFPGSVENVSTPNEEIKRDVLPQSLDDKYLVEPKIDTSYLENFEINGTEVSVGWDEGYNDYTIYIPQASALEQIVRVGGDIETAKIVFNIACKLVKEGGSLDTIMKKIESIANALDR